MKVKGALVVITGAGSGMGREMTLELLRRGARVAAIDLHAESLDETRTLALEYASKLETFVADISSEDHVARLPDQVRSAIGDPDILINNAGIIQPFVKISQLELREIRHVIDVNFYGVVYMTKAFLPGLLLRPHAHILNVSSMGAYTPVPGQSVYGASKAAVKLFTEGLCSELIKTNVGVTIAFPGAVATNIASNSGLQIPSAASQSEKFKAMRATDAARTMIDAIESGKQRITIGKDARFMDWLSRLSPRLAARIIYRNMRSLLGE